MLFLLISETQKDMRQLLVTGASFYYLRMLVSLTQYRGALGIFNTLKSILQHSRKTFSSLNNVNINSFQNYPLSTFILLVFSISGVETWWSQNLQETFCLVSFSNRFFAKHFFLTANSLSIIKWQAQNKSWPSSKARWSICHWNRNSIYAHNYVKLSLLRAFLEVFDKFDIIWTFEPYLNSSNLADDDT